MDESQYLKSITSPLYHGVPDTPNAGVPHTDVLVFLRTDFLQITDTVRPVVLELAQAGVHCVELAAAQTGEGEMVVESQDFLRVVEGLDVVTRRGVSGAPVDVLHHVKVGRNVWDVTALVPLQKIIEEVNIPEGPAGFVARGPHQVLHQVGPVGVVGGDDDLVRVEESDVLVTVHVPVKAVIVRN